MTPQETLQRWIDEAQRIVFFGGAGVSTESGIPDFRSQDGLYNQKYDYPPETILSHSFFKHHPDVFYRFYRDRVLALDAKPNAAHRKLAELEAAGKLSGIITQNIDGLHQKAGSQKVYELHGSVWRNYCTRCRKPYPVERIAREEGIPHCGDCGGLIRPDVVLYEEALDGRMIEASLRLLAAADLVIVGGTSLVVYPAAGLLDAYRGNRLVMINRTATPRDGAADLILRESIGQVLGAIQLH